jgi:hypothetical protein
MLELELEGTAMRLEWSRMLSDKGVEADLADAGAPRGATWAWVFERGEAWYWVIVKDENTIASGMARTQQSGVDAVVRWLEQSDDELLLRLSFSPTALREHFEMYDPDPTAGLSDEQLREVGWAALSDDRLYEVFHAVLADALEDVAGD